VTDGKPEPVPVPITPYSVTEGVAPRCRSVRIHAQDLAQQVPACVLGIRGIVCITDRDEELARHELELPSLVVVVR
jgi:hypothetical protein